MHPARFAALRERVDVRERRADARAVVVAMALGADVTLEGGIELLRTIPERPPDAEPLRLPRTAPVPDDETPAPPGKRPTIITFPDDPFFDPLRRGA